MNAQHQQNRSRQGDALRALRARIRLPQRELAKRLGVFLVTISQVENGHIELSKTEFERWVDAIGEAEGKP